MPTESFPLGDEWLEVFGNHADHIYSLGYTCKDIIEPKIISIVSLLVWVTKEEYAVVRRRKKVSNNPTPEPNQDLPNPPVSTTANWSFSRSCSYDT